jgi:hypothetical protein
MVSYVLGKQGDVFHWGTLSCVSKLRSAVSVEQRLEGRVSFPRGVYAYSLEELGVSPRDRRHESPYQGGEMLDALLRTQHNRLPRKSPAAV